MRALLQRVSEASVKVHGEVIASIGEGLLVFVAVERHDSSVQSERMIQRIIGYRIFPDTQNKMNLSLRQRAGELLLVPQFTLAADTNKGMRPSFTAAAHPGISERVFTQMYDQAQQLGVRTQTGRFGADMQIHLVNEGPTTFVLETR